MRNKLILLLNELADSVQAKKRVTDAIRECETALAGRLTPEEHVKVLGRLDDIVTWFEKELIPTDQAVLLQGGNETSMLAVEKRVLELKDSAEQTLLHSCSTFVNKGAREVEDAKRKLADYANVKANFRSLTQNNRFVQETEQLSNEYMQKMSAITAEDIGQMAEIYEKMVNRVRSLLAGVNAGQTQSKRREIYENWDQNQTFYYDRMKSEAERLDNGAGLIAQFGRKAAGDIAVIKKKLSSKRNFFAWLPLLIVLLLVLVFLAVGLFSGPIKRAIDGTGSAQQEEAQEETNEVGDALERAAVKFVDSFSSRLASEGVRMIFANFSLIIGGFFIPIVLIFIMLYIAWVIVVNKVLFRNWMQRSLEVYMKKQIGDFLSGNELENRNSAYFTALSAKFAEVYGGAFGGLITESRNEDPRVRKVQEARVLLNSMR